MGDIVRDEVRALSAYRVPDSRGMVKLDAMENPYSLPEAVRREIAELIAALPLNRYPEADPAELKGALAKAMDVPAGMQLLLGNGSDEIIQLIALALARPGAVLLSVEPAFVMFKMIATISGMNYVGVPLRSDFTLDSDALLSAIHTHQPAVIFLAYPNNPTGNLFDREAVRRMIEAAPGLVVVDEAYSAFAGSSFMAQLALFPNLLVMRTVSKLGLAGIRLGLLAGRARWLDEFDKLRLPYNINSMTQAIAPLVLRHRAVFLEQAARIVQQREVLYQALTQVPGVFPYRSDANFILFRISRADMVFDALKQHGILVKNVSPVHPLLHNCLRVTVGTAEENERFLSALRRIPASA
jgi:histidinol-phosphate aminotransferase